MSLLDENWKDKKQKDKLKDIESCADQKVLAYIVENDDSFDVKKAAALKITDPKTLMELRDKEVIYETIRVLDDQKALKIIATKCSDLNARMLAADYLTDENLLKEIVKNEDRIRNSNNVETEEESNIIDRFFKKIISKIDDEATLRSVLENSPSPKTRARACEKLDNGHEWYNCTCKRCRAIAAGDDEKHDYFLKVENERYVEHECYFCGTLAIKTKRRMGSSKEIESPKPNTDNIGEDHAENNVWYEGYIYPAGKEIIK